jgi:hypothetical protein
MTATFSDPTASGHLIIALPEEMPLQEALELDEILKGMFPRNSAAFLVNRRLPEVEVPQGSLAESPDDWATPVPSSALDYVRKRTLLERFNLRAWDSLPYSELGYQVPGGQPVTARLATEISREMIA